MNQLALDFDATPFVAPLRSARPRRKAAAPLLTSRARAAVTLETPKIGTASDADESAAADAALREDRLWQENGWTVRVVHDEEEGWAVEVLHDDASGPVHVAPWSLARDGQDPKPLDQAAFDSLVKTAGEALLRHERQLRAQLRRRMSVCAQDGEWEVILDIVPDEYEPHALLSAIDANGAEVARVRVPADYRFNRESVSAWIANDFRAPDDCD